MNLSQEIKNILRNNNVIEISTLKNLTRQDLKEMNLTNNQINQIIIYLQLHGLDIKKTYKKPSHC